MADWRDYQDMAAAVFSKLGCTVLVDCRIEGARASHDVDVFVSFERWGLPHTWVVECKQQTRKVSKAPVEALKSIVADVGADKGFLLAESGFQPAARAAAALTNVSLLSLDQLQAGAKPDLHRFILQRTEEQLLILLRRLERYRMKVPTDAPWTTYRRLPGVFPSCSLEAAGTLMYLQDALNNWKVELPLGVLPASFPSQLDALVELQDNDSLVREGARLVKEVKDWCDKQDQRVPRALRLLARIQSGAALYATSPN